MIINPYKKHLNAKFVKNLCKRNEITIKQCSDVIRFMLFYNKISPRKKIIQCEFLNKRNERREKKIRFVVVSRNNPYKSKINYWNYLNLMESRNSLNFKIMYELISDYQMLFYGTSIVREKDTLIENFIQKYNGETY